MNNWLTHVLVFCFLLVCNSAFSQNVDNRLWAKISITHQFNSKIKFSFGPLYRVNDNFSRLNDVALDYQVRLKAYKGWGTSLSLRQIIPLEGSQRFLIWYDISHTLNTDQYKLTNIFRIHQVLDTGSSVNADFLRWVPQLVRKTNSRFSPLIASDFWLRLNGVNTLNRYRIELGTLYKWGQNTISFKLRREEFIDDFSTDFNVVVLSYNYLMK